MSDSEFVMTYPCFFVVNEHGAPDIVQIDDALCVCLFTDSDTVQGFHQDKYGTTDAGPKVFVMKSPADLIHMLREWQTVFEHDGIRFVAFDVTPQKNPMYAPYVDLIAELEKDRP